MTKNLMIKTIAGVAMLCASAAMAANAPKGNFTTGIMSLNQVKQLKSGGKMLGVAANSLYVCNSTNLPAQTGTTIQVSFPGTGVADQFPGVGSCAFLTNSNGGFTTQVIVYAPANSGNAIYNNNMSSGQMWGVSYNSTNNTYTVYQMQ